MLTNFDCSVFYIADRSPLIETMSILPPYLRSAASDRGEVIDYRDWHVPLGRRFRALKLWFVLRSYGAEAIRTYIREHVRLAELLADRLEADPRFELVAPTPFSLVSFAHRDGDEATRRLGSAINETGEVYVTMSEVRGRAFIRVAIGSRLTTERHVERLWELIDVSAR